MLNGRTNRWMAPGRRTPATAWAAVLPWLVLLGAIWTATGLQAAGSATTAAKTIVFFGDSLTAGYGLENPAAEAYPALIQRRIEAAHLPWRVVNAGVSGATTADGLHRIDWVLRQPCDLFFLALGGNDGLRGIEPATMDRNLVGIITRVRAKYPAAKIVIAGMQMPPGMGEAYTQAFHDVFPSVAKQEHAVLLPFLLEGVAGQPDLNQPDSIHPTAAGHRLVAETVWNVLHPLL